MIRVEITDEHGTAAVIIDPPALTPEKRKSLGRAMERITGHLAAVLGVSEDHACEILLAALIRQYADEGAYARVAAQRGVLAL